MSGRITARKAAAQHPTVTSHSDQASAVLVRACSFTVWSSPPSELGDVGRSAVRDRYAPSHRQHLPQGVAVSGGQRNASASACEGVLKPRVCRGRPLSSAAIASSVAWSNRRSRRASTSTGGAGRWCSRWCRVARGFAGRRSTPARRCRSEA
jgi:hypothetical protein